MHVSQLASKLLAEQVCTLTLASFTHQMLLLIPVISTLADINFKIPKEYCFYSEIFKYFFVCVSVC